MILIVFSVAWGVFFGLSLEQYRQWEYAEEMPYGVFDFGRVMIISGLGLLALWIILDIKRRSVRVGAFIAGLFIAFCFFMAAKTQNIGWFVADIFFSHIGGGEIIALNPFLHIGGGSTSAYDYGIPDYVYRSSLAPLNMLIYFIYGEAIAFALLFLSIRLKRL
jgi:hypothetical protein